MIKNFFEGTVLGLTGRVTGGKKDAKASAKFVFTQEGGESKLGEQKVALKDGVGSCQVTLPPTKDDEENYSFTYELQAGDKKLPGEFESKVFPKHVGLQALDKDDKPFPWVEFRIVQDGKVAATARCDAGGKGAIQLLRPDLFTIEAISPYVLDSVEVAKGHQRKIKVSRKPYRCGFLFFGPASGVHKQYVNLEDVKNPKPVADKPLPNEGSLITLWAGAEEDDIRAEPHRRGKKDDPVFVTVEFDKANSKRNDPKPAAIGFKDEGDGKFTKKLLLPADGKPAEFQIQLGRAGGDKCTVRIGSSEKCEEASVTIENWRKLYYQLTVPKGDAKPAMARMLDALSAVFVEYEEYEKNEFEEKDAPGGGLLTWFPGEWIGEAGKKFVNIGDYNKGHFHARFKDTKSPIGVHVLCCHTQYDCLSPACVSRFKPEVDASTGKVPWSDGSTAMGAAVYVGRGLFPKKMKDGTSSLVSGAWAEDGGAGSGVIAEGDVWIDRKAHVGQAIIKLPAAAKVLVEAGKKIKLDLKLYCAQGPYLGESDGAKPWLQLMVVKQDGSVFNDVMSHELGHTMNQVTKSAPPGLTAGDHGRLYTGNGHMGPHCADGMSDAHYDGGAGKGAGYLKNFSGKKECTCIMYGENGPGSTCTGRFCARCSPFIKGERLTDLHGAGGKADESGKVSESDDSRSDG